VPASASERYKAALRRAYAAYCRAHG